MTTCMINNVEVVDLISFLIAYPPNEYTATRTYNSNYEYIIWSSKQPYAWVEAFISTEENRIKHIRYVLDVNEKPKNINGDIITFEELVHIVWEWYTKLKYAPEMDIVYI